MLLCDIVYTSFLHFLQMRIFNLLSVLNPIRVDLPHDLQIKAALAALTALSL